MNVGDNYNRPKVAQFLKDRDHGAKSSWKTWLYAGNPGVSENYFVGYNYLMSKNVFSGPDASREPDNPQETLEEKNFYYSGFCAAEMSCSVIKAVNHHPEGYYYAVDLTVSNADRSLLHEVNKTLMNGAGVITPVKGAFNLSARGKRKVRIALNFLEQYPIITGDLANGRIKLLKRALAFLEEKRGRAVSQEKHTEMSDIRDSLRRIKTKGIVEACRIVPASNAAVGYFLSGVLDGEGSFGLKGGREPYLFVAMKDRKIIELFREFVQYGKVRLRKDGLFHLEINRRSILERVCAIFLTQYPLRHARQRERLQKLQRILNDHTPRPLKKAA